ncbi:MAG: hypothetical protein KIT46_08000 [Anaerolineales bacterium]|nr:hypothetical protein [Anaerolineales bacterium]MCW5855973.1 hypothetical protein [Anaerolineales bacterium]
MKPKQKLLLAFLAYAVLVVLAVSLARSSMYISKPVLLVLALLPLIPGIFIVIFVARDQMMAMDELERTIQLEALSLAFGGMFLVLLASSLLGIAGVPPIDLGTALISMGVLWGAGQLLARRRYQ